MGERQEAPEQVADGVGFIENIEGGWVIRGGGGGTGRGRISTGEGGVHIFLEGAAKTPTKLWIVVTVLAAPRFN